MKVRVDQASKASAKNESNQYEYVLVHRKAILMYIILSKFKLDSLLVSMQIIDNLLVFGFASEEKLLDRVSSTLPVPLTVKS